MIDSAVKHFRSYMSPSRGSKLVSSNFFFLLYGYEDHFLRYLLFGIVVYGLWSWRPSGGVTISLGQRKHGKGVGYEHTYHLHISITPNKQLMKPIEPRNYLFKTSLKAGEIFSSRP